jgi:hypothetical protein
MNGADPTFREDLRSRVEQGVTPEMSAASRRRFVVLQSCVLAALLLSLGEGLGQRVPLSSPRMLAWTGLLLLLLAVMVRRYLRLATQPGRTASDEELAATACKSRRCHECRTIVLAGESEWPRCGALEHGGRSLTFGILFGVGMFAWALWRAGFFGG